MNKLFRLWVDSHDYDEFDEFVVIAKDEASARGMIKDRLGDPEFGQNVNDFKCERVLLNEATPGILCASFNAG